MDNKNQISLLLRIYPIAIMIIMVLPCFAAEDMVDSQPAFNEISGRTLQAGDTVFLKRGMKFYGMLMLRGSGSERFPIRIGAYGNGDRPRIAPFLVEGLTSGA